MKLLEEMPLPEGSEVTVTILDVPSVREFDAFDRAAGSWKGTVDTKKLLGYLRRSSSFKPTEIAAALTFIAIDSSS